MPHPPTTRAHPPPRMLEEGEQEGLGKARREWRAHAAARLPNFTNDTAAIHSSLRARHPTKGLRVLINFNTLPHTRKRGLRGLSKMLHATQLIPAKPGLDPSGYRPQTRNSSFLHCTQRGRVRQGPILRACGQLLHRRRGWERGGADKEPAGASPWMPGQPAAQGAGADPAGAGAAKAAQRGDCATQRGTWPPCSCAHGSSSAPHQLLELDAADEKLPYI